MERKAAFFIDVDGTIIRWKDEQPIPSAVATINKWHDEGHVIVLTTMRGDNWPEDSRFHKENSLKLFKEIGLKYDEIIWDCPSPRIVINDDGVGAIDHPRDADWDYKIIKGEPEK